MRKIAKKILHCADTRVNQNFSINDVREWHIQRGFSDVGYHFYIRLNGDIETGRTVETIGAHCKGENEDSIGICFEGGKNEDGSLWKNPLDAQIIAFFVLNESLDQEYGITPVFGHYQFSKKTCPNFNVTELMAAFFMRKK